MAKSVCNIPCPQVAAEYKEIKVMGRGAFAEVLLAKHVPTSGASGRAICKPSGFF